MADPLIGQTFAGCTISEKLGQGGMGTVYKAHQAALDKIVCVKILSPELARDQRNVEFFLREARSAAKLDHPNIVHVYNFGQENGSHFIVMSYIEGQSLEDIVKSRGGPLPIAEASELIAGVLDGLAHAHSNTIIHRDIKPSNILVDKSGRPWIADFGLARSLNEEKQLTMAGEMIGTAYFMSPEQCLAKTVDSRADLYSTGATFFYILTGKYPFDGKTSVEVIHKHLSDPVPNPMLANPDMPLWASRVIEKLMRKKPEERYQSAAEVAAEVRKYLTGELKIGEIKEREKTFDLAELSGRVQPPPPAAPKPPPPPGQAVYQPPPPPPGQKAQPPAPAEKAEPEPPQIYQQSKPVKLHFFFKFLSHLAATAGAAGFFLFAGSSGPGGSLGAPLASSPAVAGLFGALGLAMLTWAVKLKPRKFTLQHALYFVAGSAAAYSAGALLQTPGGLDTASKAFMALGTARLEWQSKDALVLYGAGLYLLASMVVFRRNWLVKGLAVLAYAGSLAIIFSYFGAGLAQTPKGVWLAVTGALALAGLAAALTQFQFSLFFNPQLFFLAANLALFALLSAPQVDALAVRKSATAAAAAERANEMSREEYRLVLAAAQAEITYDADGRPIDRRPALPREVKPPAPETLRSEARAEYHAALSAELRGFLSGPAGLLLAALFLMLAANICFAEELAALYRDSEF